LKIYRVATKLLGHSEHLWLSRPVEARIAEPGVFVVLVRPSAACESSRADIPSECTPAVWTCPIEEPHGRRVKIKAVQISVSGGNLSQTKIVFPS
jgi:hypothetical protein